MYNQELDQVKMVYNRQMVAARAPREPMTNMNMLPMAGALKWVQEVQERIGQSMEKLRAINHGSEQYCKLHFICTNDVLHVCRIL